MTVFSLAREKRQRVPQINALARGTEEGTQKFLPFCRALARRPRSVRSEHDAITAICSHRASARDLSLPVPLSADFP